MASPQVKPSERLSKFLDRNKNASDEDPRETLKKAAFHWIRSTIGWKPAGLVALILGGAFWTWSEWKSLVEKPGIRAGIAWLSERVAPVHAKGDRFTILITQLENDKDGAHRRAIREALLRTFQKDEIEILMPDRVIEIEGSEKPQDAVREGHWRALKLLRASNSNVAIWGVALDNKVDGLMQLRWTLNSGIQPRKRAERYQMSGDYDLPPLFMSDLGDLIGLLATTQYAEFVSDADAISGDRLKLFGLLPVSMTPC